MNSENGCIKGNEKCICFFFLPDKYAEVIATLFMIGICAGTHFLNIMIHEDIGAFLYTVSYIFDSIVLVSLVVFFVGLFWQKSLLLKQVTIVFAIYIFFSLSCFCCNFITLIFGDYYRESYNLFVIYKDFYIEKNPNTILEEDEIKRNIKIKFYLEAIAHMFSLGFMIYYYVTTSSYVEKLTESDEEFGRKLIERSSIKCGGNYGNNGKNNGTFISSYKNSSVI
ncbi:hypothetical protein H8356DRAFT_1018209 [Neocallimastix lanati (nom. inval.)]|nr:hypothetical protein H8356DRAFT_1018209 [Neocallimastix sp. JGI-2020a]